MKTIAIPTLGWSETDCNAFEQYINDVAEDYCTNLSVAHTSDHYFEIDIDEDDTSVEWLIVNAAAVVE